MKAPNEDLTGYIKELESDNEVLRREKERDKKSIESLNRYIKSNLQVIKKHEISSVHDKSEQIMKEYPPSDY